MTKIIFTILFSLTCGYLFAQDRIDTDRPDQTESANTMPKHYFQAEFGFSKENIKRRNYDLVHPTVLLKYGLGRFDLRAVVTHKTSYEHLIPNTKTISGFDPVEIGFRAALWEQKKILPKTSVIAHLGLPFLASTSFRPDHIAPAARLSFQNSISDHIAIGYNVGAEWDGSNSPATWVYTLSPGFEYGNWYFYIEVFGSVMKMESPVHNIDGGIAYYISDNSKIDLSAGTGISNNNPGSYVAVGYSFRLHTKKK